MISGTRDSLSQADLSTDRPQVSQWIRSSNNVTQQFMAIGGQPDIVSLAGGLPAAELYPVEAIKQAASRALDRWGSAAFRSLLWLRSRGRQLRGLLSGPAGVARQVA